MARTAIAAQIPKGPFIQGQPAAGALDLVETAGDVANGNSFVASGMDFLVVHNTDVGAQTFSISSMPDAFGRSQDVTNYSMAAGKISVFNLRDTRGWIQADGNIYINAGNANIKFAVLKIQ
jgi:hypothetical protein